MEREQLKKKAVTVSKRIQGGTVTFCDDIELHEGRFKGRLTVVTWTP